MFKRKTKAERDFDKAEQKHEHQRRYKTTVGDVIFHTLNYTVFGLFTLMCAFPFYYIFINTISENTLVSRNMINFYPQGLHINNYIALLELNEVGRAIFITTARAVIGTLVMVIASSFIGYLMTKDEMWMKKFWYRFTVVTMYFNAGLIAWFLNMMMLGLTNNFMAYIIPGLVAPFNIILVKTYIESIPIELEESAHIDGAGLLTIFTKIIWPLSKPILATIAIFGAVGHWNSFVDSLILMNNAPDLHTLQHRLFVYLTRSNNLAALMQSGTSSAAAAAALAGVTNTKVINFTISMLTILPILVVYPIMQKHFVKGIMLGAVKG
ncbi:MAG: carbohydrate ABC transporter permease [Lachnospiraceae bacterium]|jgi:multiple sugar transport system permease protein/putative aldouronate transport system permease protein|nr:carbohydrate ABC transporter permease [Lachnospiraceae bacterium]